MSSYIVGKLDLRNVDFSEEIKWLNSLPKIHEEYDEFAQGYWKNISLFNASGEINDTQFRNCPKAYPTLHLQNCVNIKRFIEESFAPEALKMVRARNLIDGMVIPHRDFVEMEENDNRFFRVFMMLENNDQAFHSDSSGVFQMRHGEVWFLDAATDHAAINFSNSSRMALCLDFIFEKDFNDYEIFEKNIIFEKGNATYKERIKIDPIEKNEIVAGIASVLSPETFKDMVFATSKYHFTHEMAVSECYDWLIDAAQNNKDRQVAEKAMALKNYLIINRGLGERFSISTW